MYDALCEEDFTEVLVVHPAHVKAVKGQKTGAKDCARLAELLECGLLQGSCIPPLPLKEVRDLARYRCKTVQARTCEVQRLDRSLESAGVKLSPVASGITGTGPTAMIEALIDGERRGEVMADLARGRARTAGKLADLPVALEGRFTEHHALMCRLILDRVAAYDTAPADLDDRIRSAAARWWQQAALLVTIPGFGEVTAWTWIAEIGPAPHQWSGSKEKLACRTGLAPGNHISAGKRKHSRAGDAGTYIKPALVQAAWAAIRVPGRLQARYNRLVRRLGGENNPGAKKKAIAAIAHTLLKIAYSVLKSGKPCQEPGEDFCTRHRNPRNRQAWLEAELRKLHPGRPVTVIIGPGDDDSSPDGCSLPGCGSPPGSKPLTATAASG